VAENQDSKIIALAYIKKQIITCALPPGTAVPIDEIAQQLGLSKTPVREALQELQYENYVTVFPRKKTVVSRISLKDLEYIYEARALNEIAILSRLTPEDINAHLEELTELRRTWADLPVIANDKDSYMAFLDRDIQFHIQLVNLSQNPHLIHFCTELIFKSERFWYMALFNNRTETVKKEHLMILDALLAGDTAAAAASAQKHITVSKALSIMSD